MTCKCWTPKEVRTNCGFARANGKCSKRKCPHPPEVMAMIDMDIRAYEILKEKDYRRKL
jgi:hypothetical protein